MNILIIIPARGGSKGIPRKNLRALANKPLISYSIQNALTSKFNPDVYVSTEDQEILTVSKKLGAKVHKRCEDDAKDATTLDPVIFHALSAIKKLENKNYDLVITLQPTSPLLKVNSIDNAIEMMIYNSSIDTIISAVNDTHLTWNKENGKFKANYVKRVNRQQLPEVYKETGGFLITRSQYITENNRIGSNVHLFELTDKESIDIDTYADWGLCQYYLQRKFILFVVSGNSEIGLGHVYNTLILANDLVQHDVTFLVDCNSELAFEKISKKNYPVYIQQSKELFEDIKRLNPDVVINDCLDTDLEYIQNIVDYGIKVINFEDLGKGADKADLVINAIYPDDNNNPDHYFGHKYFLLRDEFVLTPSKPVMRNVKKVLVSFGGVDPNNYTDKVLTSIYNFCQNNGIEINVVTGFGYKNHDSLIKFDKIKIHNNIANISDYMHEADIIFTSAGRTTYEIASQAVPSVVLAQNERELTHLFATSENGFINLGLGTNLNNQKVLDTLILLVSDYEKRKYMSELMSKCDLVSGRNVVNKLINKVISK